EAQTRRMQALVTDLLQLSRLESDPPREEERVNLPALIAAVAEEAGQLAAEKHQQLELRLESRDWLLGSSRELHSAFANLAANAVRYTPEGGHIVIRWYRDAQGGHFEVEDDGRGIAPQHLHRLTERFYRVDEDRSREHGGTGLGLAIVKHVLQRHEAELHISSQLGRGSTFRCDFPPRRLGEPDAAPDTDAATRAAGSGAA
ncbi:MAG TPA: PAS domain-containing sensor histidine kinase, partial [Chromatiales bacterium]|nr:PAS domain-containing sensor histidine kinase [Chromatiales bacterium]